MRPASSQFEFTPACLLARPGQRERGQSELGQIEFPRGTSAGALNSGAGQAGAQRALPAARPLSLQSAEWPASSVVRRRSAQWAASEPNWPEWRRKLRASPSCWPLLERLCLCRQTSWPRGARQLSRPAGLCACLVLAPFMRRQLCKRRRCLSLGANSSGALELDKT